jgi:hypothetical protein
VWRGVRRGVRGGRRYGSTKAPEAKQCNAAVRVSRFRLELHPNSAGRVGWGGVGWGPRPRWSGTIAFASDCTGPHWSEGAPTFAASRRPEEAPTMAPTPRDIRHAGADPGGFERRRWKSERLKASREPTLFVVGGRGHGGALPTGPDWPREVSARGGASTIGSARKRMTRERSDWARHNAPFGFTLYLSPRLFTSID